ncbi:larval cuticle protein LCP-22-like [Diorhabda sublineata]|uniref:larval cuticle protein LCP-22-like n=1 Tax=Diorhabda sublineata TaxID=1163346 RepID=UPI0024E17A22|nr:larval cuticle protein LCP-22-like [Diorhabda sublineata]
MIKLFLIAAVAVAATYAAPQAATTTVAPITATNDYYRQYDPYYRNTFEPYRRFNTIDPYRGNYWGNDYYRNNYRTGPYFGNDYYNRQWNDGFYRKNDFRNNVYKSDPLYYKNLYNYPDYTKNYVAGPEAAARIVRFESNVNPDGTYQYGYETDNGIAAEQQGYPVIGPDNEPGTGATGSFSFTSPEGLHFRTTYVADENGYRAQQSNDVRGVVPVPYSAKAPVVATASQTK